MRNTYTKILFSNKLTAGLLLLMPVAMAAGTFIESIYNTETAKILIYNAWWFELIMVLLALNFIGNIFKYRLLRKEKWVILMLHLSLILILLGAFVTRYFSFEGVMPIRENQTENYIISEQTYLTVYVDGQLNGQMMRKKNEKALLLSEFVDNKFSIKDKFDRQPYSITYENYKENIKEQLQPGESGENYIKLVGAYSGGRHEHYIKEGEIANIHNLLFSFNRFQQGAINITKEKGLYFIQSPFAATYLRMIDQKRGEISKNEVHPLELRALYQMGDFSFVIPEPSIRGEFSWVKTDKDDPEAQDLLTVQISVGAQKKKAVLIGGKGNVPPPKKIKVGNLEFNLQYGSKQIPLPFSIKLNDFIAEKYPGSESSYASFMSKITVEDNPSYDYDIYMNHVLDHEGYRFFQYSFSQDELGTVLSVNHDRAGTMLTYTGYMLLYVSLMGIFFVGKTRFKTLRKRLNK